MPIYEFVCTTCRTLWEEEEFDAYTKNAKHLVEGEKCGRIVRKWSSINVNTANLRSARG